MTTPNPEIGPPIKGLSPFDALLYQYVTDPYPHQPNPLAYLEEGRVHRMATHGPRTDDETRHILTTPRLLTLLAALWDEEPPTPKVVAQCAASAEGRRLLQATGHTTPTNQKTTALNVTDAAINNLLTDIEFYLLTHTEHAVPTFRGTTTPTDEPTTRTEWTYHAPATTTHPELTLTITHQPHAITGQPTLYITLTNTTNLPNPHTPWTLTWTHTTTTGQTYTHSHTQTPTPPLPTTWTIPTTQTPTTHTHITLTPNTNPEDKPTP